MSWRIVILAAWALMVASTADNGSAVAQQVAPKASNNRAAAQPPATTGDAAKKAEILNSRRWRRAMFEMNEWLSSQPYYDQKKIAAIKANLNQRVAKMNSTELEFMLEDMDAKFQIMDSKEAQDAGAWLAQYLSILSDKKREEVLKKLPNITDMTPAQLNREIAEIEQKRAQLARESALQQQPTAAPVNPWGQSTAAQQAYRNEHSPGQASYSSPYRAPSTTKPFEDARIGPSMQYYIQSNGAAGVIMNPSSW